MLAVTSTLLLLLGKINPLKKMRRRKFFVISTCAYVVFFYKEMSSVVLVSRVCTPGCALPGP